MWLHLSQPWLCNPCVSLKPSKVFRNPSRKSKKTSNYAQLLDHAICQRSATAADHLQGVQIAAVHLVSVLVFQQSHDRRRGTGHVGDLESLDGSHQTPISPDLRPPQSNERRESRR
ncbi:hypothetical protein ACFX1Z_000451 [Malus domestica]